MKRDLLIAVLLLACVYANGQSVQKGIVYEYHGREDKTPLAGVVINAGGATAKSNTYGNFKLSFNNLKVGDRVAADPDNCAMLKNYIVFNIDAVQQWNVSSSGNMFTIVLCRKDKFDKMVMTYYNASDKSLKQQLKREQERARQALKEQQIQKEEYEQLLEEANQRYQQATQSMQQNAELVARIDESELEGNQAKILELASKGKLDEAVELIMQDSTAILLERVAKKRDYSAEQRQLYEQKEAEAKREIEALIANLKNNIKVLKLAGGKENYDKCCEYWQLIVAADSTNLDNLSACAEFFCDQNDYELSEKYFSMALNLCKELAASNPDVYDIELAAIHNGLSILYSSCEYLSLSEEHAKEALAICVNLDKKKSGGNKVKIQKSKSLCGLANVQCFFYGNYESALGYYQQALKIYKELVKSNPEKHIGGVAELNLYLALVYFRLDKLGKIHGCLQQALEICDKWEKSDPINYKLLKANVLCQIAAIDPSVDYEKSGEYYQQALDIFRELAQSNPDAYNISYAAKLCDVGKFYKNTSDKALVYYNQALKIYQDMAKSYPAISNEMIASTMMDIAEIYSNIERYDSAEYYYVQSLNIFKADTSSFYESLIDLFVSDLLVKLSHLSILNSHFADAEQYARDVLGVDTMRIKETNIVGPERIQLYLQYLYNMQKGANISLVSALLCQGKYAEAEKIALEIKDVEYEERLMKEHILVNLKALEEKGVIPDERKADVERLRGVLK